MGTAIPGPVSSDDGSGIYLGVWQPGAPTDTSPLDTFEHDCGKHVAIVHWYESWENGTAPPDLGLLARVAARGSVPMLSWQPADRSGAVERPDFSLASILTGRYDEYVKIWGGKLAEYGRPVLLRWAHEMNGYWYPWGNNVNGNTADQFITAWRHLRDIFDSVHATNVQWVWSPNVVLKDELPLESLFFPGDKYVDWIGLDAFNHFAWGWTALTQLFKASYDRVTAMSTRPLMIAETGSSEAPANSGVSKAQWITDALSREVPQQLPRVRALVWFNENKRGQEKDGEDWRIESSPDARAAFAYAAANPAYRAFWDGKI